MNEDSLLRKLREAFRAEPPEPAPVGMTFEQRAALIGAIYSLLEPGNLSLRDWALQLRQVLGFAGTTRPLAEAIPTDDPVDSEPWEQDKRRELLSGIARSGLRLAEVHPIAAFGGDARSLLAEGIETALARSRPFRLLRWLAPTIVVLVAGGVIWGEVKIQGLTETLRRTENEMQAKRQEVADAAQKAEADITRRSQQAQSDWNVQLEGLLARKMGDLGSDIEQAKAAAKPRVAAALQGIADWGTQEKQQITDAANKQRDELDGLLPVVERAKAEAKPQVEAALQGIVDWGTQEKQQVTDATNKQLNDLDTLLPIVAQAKADAQPKAQQALNEVNAWAEQKRTEITDTTDRAKTTLANAVAQEKAALDKLTEDAAAARALGETRVNHEVNDLVEWGHSNKAAVAAELDQQKSSIKQDMQRQEREVAAEAGRVNTQLSGLLVDARSREDDLHKRILGAETRMQGLDEQVQGLRGTVKQAAELQSAFERAGERSKLSPAVLIRVLELKDGLAIGAFALAVLLLTMELIRFIGWVWRRRRHAAA
jgi:hypothetical protein